MLYGSFLALEPAVAALAHDVLFDAATLRSDPTERGLDRLKITDVNVNLSFATFANVNTPIAPTCFHRSRQRQAPLPASLSGARSLVR